MTPDNTDLLPCPFCGGEYLDIHHSSGVRWVVCERCNAEGPLADSFANAESEWNHRAHNPHADRLARLEVALGDVLRIWLERRREGKTEHEHTASRLERIAQLVRKVEEE